MIGYGFLGGHKLESLARIPLAHEATIISRCQSARSVHGRAAEAWNYEESDAWLRNAARVKRHSAESTGAWLKGQILDVLHQFYAGAGVRQAARMRVGAHRPFSGQTIDALPVDIDAGGYTSPTVRGLSGETPERPHPLCRPAQENTPTPVECAQAGSSLPSGVSCDREHEHTAGRQSQRNPFIGDEAPEVIERYAEIRGV